VHDALRYCTVLSWRLAYQRFSRFATGKRLLASHFFIAGEKGHDVGPISQRSGVRAASEQEETRRPTACTHLRIGKAGNYPGYGALRLRRTGHTWQLRTSSSRARNEKAAQNGWLPSSQGTSAQKGGRLHGQSHSHELEKMLASLIGWCARSATASSTRQRDSASASLAAPNG
jgi:hypothetical protein